MTAPARPVSAATWRTAATCRRDAQPARTRWMSSISRRAIATAWSSSFQPCHARMPKRPTRRAAGGMARWRRARPGSTRRRVEDRRVGGRRDHRDLARIQAGAGQEHAAHGVAVGDHAAHPARGPGQAERPRRAERALAIDEEGARPTQEHAAGRDRVRHRAVGVDHVDRLAPDQPGEPSDGPGVQAVRHRQGEVGDADLGAGGGQLQVRARGQHDGVAPADEPARGGQPESPAERLQRGVGHHGEHGEGGVWHQRKDNGAGIAPRPACPTS